MLKIILKKHHLNFGAIVSIIRCNKLGIIRAAKFWLNTLDISMFVSITRWTKLDFNVTVKVWLDALDISIDTQAFSKTKSRYGSQNLAECTNY